MSFFFCFQRGSLESSRITCDLCYSSDSVLFAETQMHKCKWVFFFFSSFGTFVHPQQSCFPSSQWPDVLQDPFQIHLQSDILLTYFYGFFKPTCWYKWAIYGNLYQTMPRKIPKFIVYSWLQCLRYKSLKDAYLVIYKHHKMHN